MFSLSDKTCPHHYRLKNLRKLEFLLSKWSHNLKNSVAYRVKLFSQGLQLAQVKSFSRPWSCLGAKSKD